MKGLYLKRNLKLRLQRLRKIFENMTVEQLNQLIDSIAKSSNQQQMKPNGITPVSPIIHFHDLRDAWLAAAMIAKKKGYPCLAELIKCSVNARIIKKQPVQAGNLEKDQKNSTIQKLYEICYEKQASKFQWIFCH